VANACGFDLNQNFARLRALKIDLHNLKWFSGGNGNGGAGSHLDILLDRYNVFAIVYRLGADAQRKANSKRAIGMKIGIFIGGIVMLAPLIACGPDAPKDPADSCGASALQSLVGQPKSRLETMRLAQPIRVIGPGMAITKDYRLERLNIDYNEKEMISRLWCG
jgi:hypothetical protein